MGFGNYSHISGWVSSGNLHRRAASSQSTPTMMTSCSSMSFAIKFSCFISLKKNFPALWWEVFEAC